MIRARSRVRLACMVLALSLALGGCARNTTRNVEVDIDGIGMEYISGQIRSFLDTHGYGRTRINDNFDGDDGLYEIRNADREIMHFRSRRFPDRKVVTRLEKPARKVYVSFIELNVSKFTPAAQAEFDEILAAIAERVGADRVKVEWW
ncbi:MAG: hypothetical protein R3286_05690 [Gammaproteobacteria bacterium]|nr:hypothetical protein [Gammaproteobacteria bacterium]